MKNYFFCLTLLVSVFIVSGVANSSPVQWGVNGHYYEQINFSDIEGGPWTWEEAKLDAEARSYLGLEGHLATLTSQEENDFVTDLFTLGGFWIGGSQAPDQATPDAGWAWVTGETWSYTNWGGTDDYPEPNDHGDFTSTENNEENYLKFERDGIKWNDVSNDYPYAYLIEYEPNPIPEPATMLLFGLGLLGLTGVIRRKK